MSSDIQQRSQNVPEAIRTRRIIGPCYGLSGCPPFRRSDVTPAVRIMNLPRA